MTDFKKGDTVTYAGEEYEVFRVDMRIKGREILLSGMDFPVSVTDVRKYTHPVPPVPLKEMERVSTWDLLSNIEHSGWHNYVKDSWGYTGVISDFYAFYQQAGMTDPYSSEEFIHTENKHSHKFVHTGANRFPDTLYYPISVMKCLTLEEETTFNDLLKKSEWFNSNHFVEMFDYSKSVVEQRVVDYISGCPAQEVVEANIARKQKWDNINKFDHDVVFADKGASPIYRSGNYLFNTFKPSPLEVWWAVENSCKYKYKVGDVFTRNGDDENYDTRYVLIVTALGADKSGNPIYHTAEVAYFPKVSATWGRVKANNDFRPDDVRRYDKSGMRGSSAMSPQARAQYIIDNCTVFKSPDYNNGDGSPRDWFAHRFFNSAHREDSLKGMHSVDITKNQLDKWAVDSFNHECTEYDNASAFYGKVREWNRVCDERKTYLENQKPRHWPSSVSYDPPVSNPYKSMYSVKGYDYATDQYMKITHNPWGALSN